MPKCEVVLDCMPDKPISSSWTHTTEGGLLITIAPLSLNDPAVRPGIQVSELLPEHLPKSIRTVFRALEGSTLQPFEAEVLDFEDPSLWRRLEDMNDTKQLVLRLGLRDIEAPSGVRVKANSAQQKQPQDNVIDLTGGEDDP